MVLVVCAQVIVVPALALEPSGRPSSLSPMAPTGTPVFAGEPTGAPAELSPSAAFAPLRLSLLSAQFPKGDPFGDGSCGQRMEPSGNTINGFAVQRHALARLTPRLVLHGFSQTGCAFDAGAGTGLTYAMPLKPNLWVVASAGAYVVPGLNSAKPTTAFDARLDVVQRAGDRSLRVGLGARGVSFGGDW